MIAPCKGCDHRRVACWAECEDYAAWKAEMDAERKARLDERDQQIRLNAIARRRRKQWRWRK